MKHATLLVPLLGLTLALSGCSTTRADGAANTDRGPRAVVAAESGRTQLHREYADQKRQEDFIANRDGTRVPR